MSQTTEVADSEEINHFADAVDWDDAQVLGEHLHVACDEDEDDDDRDLSQLPATQLESATVHPPNIRNKFKTFCFERMFYKAPGWDQSGKLPWGKDSLLNDFITEHNISRKKASMWWLELRRVRGCLEDIHVPGSSLSFKAKYDLVLKDHIPSMCHGAFSVLKKRSENIVQFRPEVKDDITYLESVFSELIAFLSLRIGKYNTILADNISGMNPSNKSSRLAAFEEEISTTRVSSYLTISQTTFSGISNETNLRHLFVILDMELLKIWNAKMNEEISVSLASSFDDNDLEDIVCNSSGLIYYISGWLLYRISRHSGKFSHAFVLFAKTNSFHANSIDLNEMPTGLVDAREKHAGCLKRVGKRFFRFICIVECIFHINLRNKDALWFYRDEIFQRIRDEMNVSLQVKEAFEVCVSDIDQEGKDAILSYILDKYRNLRAKDFVGLLRRCSDSPDNIHFRQSVLVTHLMAQGKTPSVLNTNT